MEVLKKQLEHPNTIIVKNEFYPSGLTEQNLYDYYFLQKNKILEQLKDRYVMFFLGMDVNKTIVKRKLNNEFIKLTSENYSKLITGRTLSLHCTMKNIESFGIIDIDGYDFQEIKKATYEVFIYLSNNFKEYNYSLRFTGKTGFHIVCYFKKKYNINVIKEKLILLLQKFKFEENYTVGAAKRGEKVNLDLSSNKYNGGFICLHSLSVIGLRCMEIDIKYLKLFEKKQAMI